MNTYYLPGSVDRPTVISIARDEGAERYKIAQAIMAKGEPDPRETVDFDVIEVERDDTVVLNDESFFLI